MPKALESGTLRVSGASVGAAFLISSRRLLTCTHVLAASPGADWFLESPLLPGRRFSGKVVRWLEPASGDDPRDVALVEMDEDAPWPLKPVKICQEEDTENHEFAVWGFPRANPGGVTTRGVIRTNQSALHLQLEISSGTSLGVEEGYSGGAVWDERLGAAVGIVVSRMANSGTRVAFALPLRTVAQAWPEVAEYTRKATTCGASRPELPGNYVVRGRIAGAIKERLFPQRRLGGKFGTLFGRKGPPQKRICILCGPSGSGKTTQATEIFDGHEGERKWLDLRDPKSAVQAEGLGLWIVDGFDECPDLTSALQRVRPLTGSILCLTSQEVVAKRILADLGVANEARHAVVRIEGFDDNEAWQFVEKTIVDMHLLSEPRSRARQINRALCGSPLLWQLTAELINSHQLPQFLGSADESLGREEVSRKVFDAWFARTQDLCPDAVLVAHVLSGITILGMDCAALGFILEKPQSAIDRALEPLVSRGLVRFVTPSDLALTPHGLLREATNIVHGKPDAVYEKRYQNFLDRAIGGMSGGGCSRITLIDAWLVGMRQTFLDGGSSIGSFGAYGQKARQLDAILSEASERDGPVRLLGEILRPLITQLRCYEVMPIARMIKQLTPNRTFSEMIWNGASLEVEHPDEIARAYCVAAAAFHWNGQGEEIASEGATRLREHLAGYVKRSQDKRSPFEFAAAVAGLVRLASVSDAKGLLAAGDHGERSLAVLALLLSMSTVATRHEVGEEASKMLPGLGLDSEKLLVASYLKRWGLPIVIPNVADVEFNPYRGYALGEISNAPEFRSLWRPLHQRDEVSKVVAVSGSRVRGRVFWTGHQRRRGAIRNGLLALSFGGATGGAAGGCSAGGKVANAVHRWGAPTPRA